MGGLFGRGNAQNATQPTIAQGIRVQSSVYGKAIPIVYGTNRLSGNLLWYGSFTAIPVASPQGGGGKGGGNASGGTQSYTYTAAVAIALCEGGPINGIGSIWYNTSTLNVVAGQPVPAAQLGFSFFPGSYTQAPWSYLSTNFPSQALNYRGIAYLVNPALDLGSSASLPNYSFEVMGQFCTAGVPMDVNPGQIIPDMLTNANYGCTWDPSWINATHLNWYTIYCYAMGFLFSPVYDSQTQALQNLQDLLDSSNSTCWWSEGALKIMSYVDQAFTGNGYSYNLPQSWQPIYDLTDDDFIYQDGQDPVQVARSAPADAYNVVDVEFVNRANAYATEIAEAKDTYAVSLYGYRPDMVRSYHHITQQPVAQTCAQLLLQRDLYIRNTYTFTLGWKYCALEPMDLVTITDPLMGFNKWPVRITGVEENDNGELAITAEDFPLGFATPALYGAQQPNGAAPNWNAPAQNPAQVVFYEPPGELTNNQLMLWVGIGGHVNYGGCDIWASVDGLEYVYEGTVHGTARVGTATTNLSFGPDPDTTQILGVNLGNSLGTLASGSQQDADTYNTLCVLGQELISYETAALTAANRYNLTYLRRGAYGSPVVGHAAGEQFMRFDSAVFSYQFDQARIGTPVYFKFLAFNPYEGGKQTLDTAAVHTYTILGNALTTPLPNVTGLYVNFVAGITRIFWAPVTDYRPLDYEVRMGPFWQAGQVLGRTTTAQFNSQGDGIYWVAAHYTAPSGENIYSAMPVDLLVTGSVLLQNVVVAYDEAANGWPGVCTGGAAINTALNALVLDGTNNFLGLASVLTTADVLWAGGVQTSGAYALPGSQTVNVGYLATCSVRMSYTAHAVSIYDNFLTVPNVLVAPDLLGDALGTLITVTPQIAVAPVSGVFGAWQNYQPGDYVGQYFKAQLLLTSMNATTTCEVTDLTFAVDVPDRVDTYTNVAVAAAGTVVTFQQPPGTPSPFNGGPNGAAAPNLQVTIINAVAGDQVIVTKTIVSATIQVMNGGIGVARIVDVIAQGY